MPWPNPPVPSETLAILLLSGGHERAHYAFVLATGAAAVGRSVVIFATNGGCHALLRDWSGIEDAERDALVRARGVAGMDALRDAAGELGIRMIACEAGLRAEALEQAPLLDGVEVAGIATFLEAARGGQIAVI